MANVNQLPVVGFQTSQVVLGFVHGDPVLGAMGDNFSFDVQIPSNNRTIQLTLNTGNTEATRFLVNWGDGAYSTASVSATGTVTNGSHTYSSAGAYTISVKEFKE